MSDVRTSRPDRRAVGPLASWIPVRDAQGRVHLEARWLCARDAGRGSAAPAA